MPLRELRPCITHSNFMTREVVEKMPKLGVVADIQPAWLYLDARALEKQFGYDRLRYFQPLQSIFKAGGIAGGGSDHSEDRLAARRQSLQPLPGMWTTITRQAKWHDRRLHLEEALTREQALRFYAINNAYLMFLEDTVGSLEEGKRADLAVLDKDILTCPVEDIKGIQVLHTYLDGKLVFERK
jgi:predicted amidohydrolase YtcJ